MQKAQKSCRLGPIRHEMGSTQILHTNIHIHTIATCKCGNKCLKMSWWRHVAWQRQRTVRMRVEKAHT